MTTHQEHHAYNADVQPGDTIVLAKGGLLLVTAVSDGECTENSVYTCTATTDGIVSGYDCHELCAANDLPVYRNQRLLFGDELRVLP